MGMKPIGWAVFIVFCLFVVSCNTTDSKSTVPASAGIVDSAQIDGVADAAFADNHTGAAKYAVVNFDTRNIDTFYGSHVKLSLDSRSVSLKVNRSNDKDSVSNEIFESVIYNHGIYLIYKGVKYKFQQFHFHHSSEHAVDSVIYPMELHVVFYDSLSSTRMYVCRLITLGGRDDPNIQSLWNLIADKGKEQTTPFLFDIETFLPMKLINHYFIYSGINSNKGRKEEVIYFVLKEKMVISLAQIEHFSNLKCGTIESRQVITKKCVFQSVD